MELIAPRPPFYFPLVIGISKGVISRFQLFDLLLDVKTNWHQYSPSYCLFSPLLFLYTFERSFCLFSSFRQFHQRNTCTLYELASSSFHAMIIRLECHTILSFGDRSYWKHQACFL